MRKKSNRLMGVARLAMKLGREHLSDYGAVTSRKDFTQRQLMACLVLRAYLKTTYRGLIEILETSEKVCTGRLSHCSPMRILIVENDKKKVGPFLVKELQGANYSATLVASCSAAHDALADGTYDAIVLDIGLPDGDGLALLAEWRSNGFNEPVLILSARDAVHDRVRGLNLEADDYLAKPFSFDELLARVRSLFRRHGGKKATVFEHRGIKLDLLAQTVERTGQRIDLTTREYALLELLMQNQGRVVTRTMIAEKIWDSHYDLDANLIDVYMSRLRRKLDGENTDPLFKTLRGTGFQML
jgi:DNA-binding response OmpR family regulator